MKIKSSGVELYLQKTRVCTLDLLAREKSMDYFDMQKIEYCLHKVGTGGGYIIFYSRFGNNISFDFGYKSNPEIQRGISLIQKKFPEIEIQEISKDNWPFYQKDRFILLMMFCCCFPLGLFLMWYYRKYNKTARITLTLLFLSLWSVGVLSAWDNYQTATRELNVAMQQAYQDLENIYQYPQTQESETATEMSNAESEEESSSIFEVGDIFESDELTIMYIDSGEYRSDNMFIEPAEGNKFIYVEFSIHNLGKHDLSIGGASFDCYADDSLCSQPLVTADDQMEIISTVSPDKYLKGKIYFEVPLDSQEIEIEYETDFWTEDKIYFVVQ